MSLPAAFHSFVGRFPRNLGLPVVCILLCVRAGAGETDWRVESAQLDAEGSLEVRFAAEADHYYRLLRGASATQIQTTVAVGFGGLFTAPATGESGYFQVESVLRSSSLDSDNDGLPDVYELGRPSFDPLAALDATLDFDGDGFTNLDEFRQGTDPLVAQPGLTTLTSSPLHGDDGVAVTRETVLNFSRPLAVETLVDGTRLFAEAAGRKVLGRADLSPDRRKATLFYLEPLPSGTRVRVTLDGSAIKDADGRLLDADGDGIEGGVARVEFDTLNNRPVPGTAVVGRVFASELVPGVDTGTNAINRPLKGATITVSGMEETIRAVTDAEGNFKLTNAPAGRFFVHVDGRTAEGSQWPDGDFYPFVGKAWEAVAGRLDNWAGGTGEIFLPLIQAGSLKSVSALGPTYVSFPSAVVAANPALEGVALMVPANALTDDNGARGGRVGIAPVPPNRLPEALPDDLQFPLVITVQTDGPRNFSEPVPVCFPNLPDSASGRALPPGAKSALWSFDHDKGYWEIVGPMTVSANGRLICSDPGMGIRQPGWHGTQPGTGGRGGSIKKEKEEKKRCEILILGPTVGPTNKVIEFGNNIPGSRGGIWRWSALEGIPNSGVGTSFRTRFEREGVFQVSVRYMTPKGDAQCTDIHTIEIKPDPCEVGILGPVDVVNQSTYTFTARGSPGGGRYVWSSASQELTLHSVIAMPDGSSQVSVMTGFFAGEHDFSVEYILHQGTPQETKCRETHTLVVSERLTLTGLDGVEIGPATQAVRDKILYMRGNLTEGRYAWSASEGVGIVTRGSSSYAVEVAFNSPGVKTITATYTPFDPSKRPQTVSVSVRVRDVCQISIPEGFRPDWPPGQPVSFSASTVPANEGTVTWSAPGGTPSTGRGLSFTTEYATQGPKLVTAKFTNPTGDECEAIAGVHVGPIDCRINVTGPNSVSVVDGAQYLAQGNGESEAVYRAILVETGEVLGVGFGNPLAFTFVPALLRPGLYTFRVTYSATFHSVYAGECSVDYPVLVTPPPPVAARSAPGRHAVPEDTETGELEPATGRHLFARMNLQTGSIIRGETAPNGVAHPRPLRLAANTPFSQFVLNTETLQLAQAEFTTPGDGGTFEFPDFILRPDFSPDSDGDGLADQAEWVAGSDPAKPDTDGDGVTDAAEVRSGTSPTGPDSAGPGLVGTAATGGYAWDVCLIGNRALVAAGPAGLAVFNIFDRQRPILIGQADTPGEARAVACVGDFAVVADGAAGLALVDLQSVPNLSVSRQLHLGAPVNAVVASSGTIFAGLATGYIVVLDPASGVELVRRGIEGVVEDLVVQGRWLYALTLRQGRMRVTALEWVNGNLESRSEMELNGQQGAGGRRLRLVVAGDRLYAVFTQGYAVLNIARPTDLSLIREVVTGQAGWRHFGLNAGGLLVAAADPVSTDESAHDIQLHRLGADGTTPQFELQIPTPGSAEAVALEDGLAYVADGEAGLQVIRFQDADRAGLPPSVTVRTPGAGATLEENRLAAFFALATDDVGVARVEFLVDGFLVATDEQFPFELNFVAPPRAPDRDRMRVQARATDTGGNVGTSAELVLQLTGDVTPPEVVGSSPGDGQEISGTAVNAFIVRLSEAVEVESVTGANFTLIQAGPDNQFDTGDDVPINGLIVNQPTEQRLLLEFPQPLNTGRYRATLGPGLRDAAGNLDDTAYRWEFRMIGPKVSANLPASYGTSAGYAIRLRFSRAMDELSTAAAWRVFASGPDGSPDTPDDVPVSASVHFEAAGSEAVMRFNPPLPPGQYFVRVDATATDTFGRVLHEPWGTYFYVSQLDYSNAMSFERSGNALGEMNTGQEYRLRFDAAMELAVINTRRSTVTLRRPNGTEIARDSAAVFRAHITGAGDYVLAIARTENGQGSEYRVELREFTSESFQHDVTGQASATLNGRAQLLPGDVDEHRVILEAGRQYWIAPEADAETACRLQWSVFAPDGSPLLSKSSQCSAPLLVDVAVGGKFRVVLEAAGTVVVPRLAVTRR